jgi:hypothetical protein
MDSFASTALQIAAGLFTAYVMYVISLWVLAADSLGQLGEIQQGLQRKTQILDGVIEATQVKARVWNTVLPVGSQLPYIDVRRSVNRKGGTQFSYSFWLYIDNIASIHNTNSNANAFNNLQSAADIAAGTTMIGENQYTIENNPNLYTLMIKGDKRTFRYKVGTGTYKHGRYVMCPQIAIGDPQSKEMHVYFNTLDRVDQCIILKAVPDHDSTVRHNLPALIEKSWTMYTFVFMDYVPINDFESGIVIKSYVNDAFYQMDRLPGSIRENDGELSILPDGAPGSDTSYPTRLLMSTTDYFNYALSDADVTRRYNAGYNKEPNNDVDKDATGKDRQVKFSAYNKLDIYNV